MSKIDDGLVIDILGVPVTPVGVQEIFEKIDTFVKAGLKAKIIGYVNLHGLYLAIKNASMKTFYDASSINYIDGTPVIWIAKATGTPVNINHRITFLDFVYDFFEHCANKNYRVLWLGGEEQSIKKGVDVVKEKIKGVVLEGVNGYKSNEEYLDIIDSFKPHVILLGLGMPRQESWVLKNKNVLDVNVIWCIGATVDFISGKAITPPRWTGKIGIEWFFRFINEPKRMFFRYFIEPFIVLYYLIFRHRLKNKKKIISLPD